MSRDAIPAAVIRTGGLGDFVLALPLLRALHDAGRTVRLFSSPGYLELVADSDWVAERRSLDAAELHSLFADPTRRAREALVGREVYSFWSDPEGWLEAGAVRCGAARFVRLQSRPARPPHVALRALQAAELRADAEVLDRALLPRTGCGDGTLWLHPGSGSPRKNAPLEWYTRLAAAWQGPVAVTLGEAELEQLDGYRRSFEPIGAELVCPPDVRALGRELATRASAFVGNDTGPTHLAAALGIPTIAVFIRTDPELWRPIGPRVRIWRDLALGADRTLAALPARA